MGVIFTSLEPKAEETGRIIAASLQIPVEGIQGLEEHHRRGTAYGTREQFEQAIAGLFARPDRLVYGQETAEEAYGRFSTSLCSVLQRADLWPPIA